MIMVNIMLGMDRYYLDVIFTEKKIEGMNIT